MSPPLPTPDPAEGEAAAAAANEARASVSAQLTAGTLDLTGLFGQVDEEKGEGDPHYIIGHMHARHALIALPHIGEVKADKILDDLGIKHDEHLAEIGADQRVALEQAVIDA